MTKSSNNSAPDLKCKSCGYSLRSRPYQDVDAAHDASHTSHPRPHLNILKPALQCRTIEAYTDGEDRRAHALAILSEIPVGIFSVTPFRLQEICGPLIPWTRPKPGEPIATVLPILSFEAARRVLSAWASWTFAHNANLRR